MTRVVWQNIYASRADTQTILFNVMQRTSLLERKNTDEKSSIMSILLSPLQKMSYWRIIKE